MKWLEVLGEERKGNEENFLHAFGAQPLDCPRKRRLQPLRGAHAALIAEQMRPRPTGVLLCTQLADQTHRLLDLFRIRIALLEQAHRQTMGAAPQVNSRTGRELPQNRSGSLDQRL